ncbi:hypothetical protein BCR42DRAFT_497124 [Absidia repens]|uniref:Heterokaryon incompatibility domain-containing protein n=1 Tax=Absidia repens TaxID=90262 RepID=A0A1X2HY78_9FUNG|nr:hypothetical protein BCR42DRAFT_497124 [Absidia repens]
MTSDAAVNELGQDLSLKDTQQQQQQKESFQVVLVDIEKAAKDKVIHCIKKPLEDKNLKFVALSYRWGELHETLIDTKVGYIASITSFHLNDFYQLCHMMTLESNLKHIKYVWVDAICVDQRPSKRKATIYQMSNIYERATYILAVPDLHLTYLKGVSLKNNDTIEGANEYSKDIYYLLHGNTDGLVALDLASLDDFGVPKNPPALRQLLLKCTDHFGHSFMTYTRHDELYCPVLALDHICVSNALQRDQWKAWVKNSKKSFGDLHQCHEVICPLKMFYEYDFGTTPKEYCQFDGAKWKSKILARSNSIRQSMEFLTDLIKDWSSRVWVISEYSIAKKKNNLKYWFTQLSFPYNGTAYYDHMKEEKEKLSFFKFDFNDSSFSDFMMDVDYYKDQSEVKFTRSRTTNPVYIQFHSTMIRQLRQQTFLEMMLRSKASRNEDRFYSILPLSEHADQKTEVSHWNIQSMVSVKLKLYEIMNIKNKLALLFWSTHENAIKNDVLPTFATSTLPAEFQLGIFLNIISHYPCNFDLNNPSTITFHHHKQQTNNNRQQDDDDDCHRYFLRLIPEKYHVMHHHNLPEAAIYLLRDSIPICKRLGIYHAFTETLDIVAIPAFPTSGFHSTCDEFYHLQSFILLVRSFVENKWMIPCKHYAYDTSDYDEVYLDDSEGESSADFFDIY